MTWMTENLHRNSESKEREKKLCQGLKQKTGASAIAIQQCRGLSFGTRLPELWSSEKDHTNPGMLNMDVENQLVCLPPNGSASEEPAHVKSIRQRFLPASWKKAIGIVISLLIFGTVLFFLGTLVPLNHQQDAIKCPPDWIGHQGHCYKLSGEEKNWKESQNFCISHTASLAKITQEEMDFVRMLAGHHVFWIGLKREPDQPWKWLDGENATLEVMGNGGDCVYLDDGATVSSGRCTTEHRYICKKN